MYYFGARFYDPIAMRFISVDPAGQYFSPYIYGGGNPTIGADPNGEWFWAAIFIANMLRGAYQGWQTGTDPFSRLLGASAFATATYFCTDATSALSGKSAIFAGFFSSFMNSAMAPPGSDFTINLGFGSLNLDKGGLGWNVPWRSMNEFMDWAAVYSDFDKLDWAVTANPEQKEFENHYKNWKDENPPLGFESNKHIGSPAEFEQAGTIKNPESGFAKLGGYSTKGDLPDAQHARVGHVHFTNLNGKILGHWDRSRNTALWRTGIAPHVVLEWLPDKVEVLRPVSMGADVAYHWRYINSR